MAMTTDLSQLRSVLEAIGYYRKSTPRMFVKAKSLTTLLSQGVNLKFTADHLKIVEKLLIDVAGPTVLAVQNFHAAISGDMPFRHDRRVGGRSRCSSRTGINGQGGTAVGVLEPVKPPERTKLECNRTIKIECAAIVGATNKPRLLFYGMPLVVVIDHQPLNQLGSLATKVNRVQRWFDVLSA